MLSKTDLESFRLLFINNITRRILRMFCFDCFGLLEINCFIEIETP